MAKRYFMDTYLFNGDIIHGEYTESEVRELLYSHDVLRWPEYEQINAHGVIKYVRYVEDSKTIGERQREINRAILDTIDPDEWCPYD